ncbi:MAG: uncharacterized protein QOE92_1447, partial [Chloroflexota bacterium]|nr:uncharacterized protein [Chloroflexota bacterium]
MPDYVDLVTYIVTNIVDNPEAVVVETHPGRGRSQTVEISLDPGDVGRVIGKGGRNIEAIRALVKAASIKDHERVNVEVLADDLPRDDVSGDGPAEADGEYADDDAAGGADDDAAGGAEDDAADDADVDTAGSGLG